METEMHNKHPHTTCEPAHYKSSPFLSSASREMLLPVSRGEFTMTRPIKPGPTHVRRRCPDCGSSLIKRSSEAKHALMSSTFLVCKNVVCGATFAGYDEITHRLSPPSFPNPEINLPYASTAIRRGVLEHLGITQSPPVEESPTGASGAPV